jgi:hypothetical protein
MIMNTADMLIHVHPELDAESRADLEKMVAVRVGVDCAEFDHHTHPHALVVKYDPDTIQGMQILDMVRKVDPVATRIGL